MGLEDEGSWAGKEKAIVRCSQPLGPCIRLLPRSLPPVALPPPTAGPLGTGLYRSGVLPLLLTRLN